MKSYARWLLVFVEDNDDYMNRLCRLLNDVVQINNTSFVVATVSGVTDKDVEDHLRKKTTYNFFLSPLSRGYGPPDVVKAVNEMKTATIPKLLQRKISRIKGDLEIFWERYSLTDVKNSGDGASTTSQDRDIEEEIARLVGLAAFKRTIRTIEATTKRRRRLGQSNNLLALNTMMIGNPGTCKTTAARLYARKLKALGLLSKGHLIETDRSGLVANYVGQTETKTLEVLKKALGGVLYIDEAYALYSTSNSDFGRTAIAVINKFMEDHRDDIVVVMSGYKEEMEELIGMNSGLESRFPIQIEFPDYTEQELCDIADRMALEAGLIIPEGFDFVLSRIVRSFRGKAGKTFGNGRFIRNLIEEIEREMALRMLDQGLLDADRHADDEAQFSTVAIDDVWATGERMCGLTRVEMPVGALHLSEPLRISPRLHLIVEDAEPS